MSHTWSPEDSKKLFEAVKSATTVEEAINSARRALKWNVTFDSIDRRLVRMGKGRLNAIVQKNAPRDPVVEHKKRDLLTELQAEVKKLVGELADRDDQITHLKAMGKVRSAGPITEGRRVGAKQRRGTPVMVVSDLHVEERVDPKTVNGLNRYDLDIADKALASLAESFTWMTLDSRFDVREAVIAILGDLFSGHIHEELMEGNFLSPVQATAWLLPRLEKMLRVMAANCPSIERFIVVCNDGNHGRLTRKMRMATRTANSLEWLLYFNLAARFQGDKRFQFQIADGVWNYLDIYGKTHGYCHGDIYRYQGGVGGLLIPVRRGLNEDRKYIGFNPEAGDGARPVKRLDHVSMGHFHTRMDLDEGLTVNGSMIGITPYSMSIHAPPEAPKQSWYMIDSRRGKCLSAPIWLPPRQAPREDEVAGK